VNDVSSASGGPHPDQASRFQPFDRSYSLKEVAGILGVGTTTVRRLVAGGAIAHQRVSERRLVIRESALKAYLDSVSVDRG
jgi:excisionase family DNA binding protein